MIRDIETCRDYGADCDKKNWLQLLEHYNNRSMKTWKKLNLRKANEELIELLDDGHKIDLLTDWHWRIDGVVDIYPSTKTYNLFNTKEYKQYEGTLTKFVKSL